MLKKINFIYLSAVVFVLLSACSTTVKINNEDFDEVVLELAYLTGIKDGFFDIYSGVNNAAVNTMEIVFKHYKYAEAAKINAVRKDFNKKIQAMDSADYYKQYIDKLIIQYYKPILLENFSVQEVIVLHRFFNVESGKQFLQKKQRLARQFNEQAVIAYNDIVREFQNGYINRLEKTH